jgi:SCY1-like protein 1
MSYFDFAKNLTLRALGPQGPDVSFTVGDPLDFQSTNTPWMLHKGTKKDDKSPVLVFVYDMAKTTGSAFARNALKRAKTIRYPDMLRFVDGIEHEGKIYLGTEYAEPLSSKIGRLKDKNLIKHGIYRIALTLGYMNEDANLIHGNLNSDSIFVTKAGEWKYFILMLDWVD